MKLSWLLLDFRFVRSRVQPVWVWREVRKKSTTASFWSESSNAPAKMLNDLFRTYLTIWINEWLRIETLIYSTNSRLNSRFLLKRSKCAWFNRCWALCVSIRSMSEWTRRRTTTRSWGRPPENSSGSWSSVRAKQCRYGNGSETSQWTSIGTSTRCKQCNGCCDRTKYSNECY